MDPWCSNLRQWGWGEKREGAVGGGKGGVGGGGGGGGGGGHAIKHVLWGPEFTWPCIAGYQV